MRTSPGWWRDAVIYQIYPRSFADADGDGIGDLPGVVSRLPHLADLGVDAIWLSPFYVSPQHDAGYDVADYRAVDPVFGTLDDADRLIEAAHTHGLRIIVDLVPNHTSWDHPWFQSALHLGPDSPERAFYLFREGQGSDGADPPNNWQSVFGGPAWTRVTEPDGRLGAWYLHMYDSSQPDLDWTNPVVRAEFESILRFWLDRGVDGFRVDVAHGLVKAADLPDWEAEPATRTRPPMWDQDGVHEIYRAWRVVLDEYDHQPILVAEAWVEPAERLMRYLRPDEMHQAFNFEFLFTPWDAARLRASIDRVRIAAAAVGSVPTWVLSNHDVVRHTTRLVMPPPDSHIRGIGPNDPQPDEAHGLRRGRAATLLMLALPGGTYLYQGEELGLPEHTTLPDEMRQDPTFGRTHGEMLGRDGCRVPMPWEELAPSYGFSSTSNSWLPQPPSWAHYAADIQRGVEDSTLEMYRRAIALRAAHGMGAGEIRWIESPEEGLLVFDNSGITVIVNTGTEAVTMGDPGSVLLASGHIEVAAGDDTMLIPGDTTVWAT